MSEGRLRGAVVAEQPCRQADEGGECHGAVRWAKDVGIFQHPEWYPDLTPDSPAEDFQAHLHSINHGNCPQPCNATSVPVPPATPACHTAVEGEACYGAVRWAVDTGIFQHPEWYPDLTPDSPMEDFQARLHSINHSNCPEPCNATSVTLPPATPACHTAVDGEACYGAVRWVADIGIFENPEWYPELTPDSPIEDFQAHLHSINHGNCPEPCNATSVTPPPATPVCHTAIEGEDCYGTVTWAMETGIFSNPDWYPNLTSSSSFEDFQARLHSIRH